MRINQNFTTPKLCTRRGDLKKDWFVYFYYTDRQTGEKKLLRYKLGINRFRTKKERETEGESIKSELTQRLKNNWNPLSDIVESSDNDITVSDAIERAMALKKPSLKRSSYKVYSDHCKVFKDFLKKNRFDSMFIYNFTRTHAQMYFDYLLINRGWGPATHNNHLASLHSLFKILIERRIVNENPCKGISKIREDIGKNTTYSTHDESLFKDYCSQSAKLSGFYLATRFVRYCFLRRPELHGLKVGHINLTNKTIIIPSATAKSRRQDSITIPKTMESIIVDSGIMNLDPSSFVFGSGFNPGTDHVGDDSVFSVKQNIINRKIGIRNECTFYSWKHTGVVDLYNITKDPYTVMRQCRHKDLETTMRYLRSLGCGVNELVREW